MGHFPFLLQWTKQQKLGKLDGQRTEPVIRKRRYIKTPVKYPLISAAGKYGPKYICY